MFKRVVVGVFLAALAAFASALAPTNPNASAKAKAIYTYLQDLKGNGILSGQESMMWDSSTLGSTSYTAASPYSFRDRYVARQNGGKYPAIYESDFGDIDTVHLSDRQRVVDILKARAPKNTIFMLNWHTGTSAVADGDGYNGAKTLTNSAAIIDKMLTPGDALNTKWLGRLDVIAGYLKQLRDSNIVVLWRPFHENNGNFFWWGQQPRFKELWRQMYDRFTRYHKLDNLLWVYNANHFAPTGTDANWVRKNYPGDSLVDVMAVDVYAPYFSFQKHMYDTLKAIGGDKPVGISENGLMPEVDKLFSEGQNYVFWVTWWGFETTRTDNLTGNAVSQYPKAYGSSYTITEDEINFNVKPDGRKTLGVTASQGGSVTRSIDGRVDSGTVVTLTAVPETGYDFVGWTGDTTATAAVLKITVTRDRNLLASFKPKAGTNLIKDGDFAATTAWGFYAATGNSATATYPGGVANIAIASQDDTNYHIQLSQDKIPLDSGVTYILSFDGSASTARSIAFGFSSGAPDWKWLGGGDAALTTANATYSVEIEALGTSAGATLQFNLGGSTGTIKLDNVTLVRKTASIAPRQSMGSGWTLQQTTRGLEWNRADAGGSANLSLVDLSGREVWSTKVGPGIRSGMVPVSVTGVRFLVVASEGTRSILPVLPGR